MSNLNPEPRADKNGKVTTRWVKPDQQSSSRSMFPPVSLTQNGRGIDRSVLLKSINDRFNARPSWDLDLAGTFKALESFSDDTLTVIKAELDKEESEDRIQTTSFWITTYDHNEKLLREVLHYWDAFDPSTDYNFVDESISHLHELEVLPPLEDYSKADPDLQQTIHNVLSTTESLFSEAYEDNADEVYPLLPQPLCALVMRRPDDFDQINDIILDHGISDAEQIEMMLDADTQSLRDGIL